MLKGMLCVYTHMRAHTHNITSLEPRKNWEFCALGTTCFIQCMHTALPLNKTVV